MSTRMLIDARHSEETRVTVLKGNRVEDFDYESASRRQLKGNIYLARITRVEPSLQAAFVEYGGNRHGFLAFSEIHPDYYQMPLEDRQALMEAETKAIAAEKAAEDAAEEAEPKKPRRRRGRKPAAEATVDTDAVVTQDLPETNADASAEATISSDKEASGGATNGETATEGEAESGEPEGSTELDDEADSFASGSSAEATADSIDEFNEDGVAVIADLKESEEEEKDAEIEAVAAIRNRNLRSLKRRYSIQEVIKRRQVVLIQVVKEERGNKGAALTTYVSLAGRYCVLMPNSTHSGGISRKISNLGDRKTLKQITASLDVPEDMGLIVRTAGMNRTKAEIKRDYDYLLRLWNGIRELTLKSVAPALIYEEGNLIKRTIRDLYSRDIDEIWVEGDEGYRAAKDFMKLLMPSHAKKVQHYQDRIPLYHRYQVENELEAMYQPVVQLRSGGYIVINPTEALISIDVNSGRATKESSIEETAVKTNLEAAEEVARQLRLRDMAGLVVIDFIDMEDRGHNRAVERRMKDMLKNDRARIQVGPISSFGLMEMSRQRMRPNLLEASMETCKHCSGTGLTRSVESAAIMAIHQLEEEGIRKRSSLVRLAVNPDVAVYLLNKKRADLFELEQQYGYVIEILAQPSLGPSDVELTRETGGDIKPMTAAQSAVVKMDSPVQESELSKTNAEPEIIPVTVAGSAPGAANPEENGALDDDQPRKKRRRRRRRRRGGEDDDEGLSVSAAPSSEDGTVSETSEAGDGDASQKTDAPSEADGGSRRRRGSRGGKRRRPRGDEASQTVGSDPAKAEQAVNVADADVAPTVGDSAPSAMPTEDRPVRRRRRVKKSDDNQVATKEGMVGADLAGKDVVGESHSTAASSDAASDSTIAEEKPAKRAPTRRRAAAKKPVSSGGPDESQAEPAPKASAPAAASGAEIEEKPKPRRRRASNAKSPSGLAPDQHEGAAGQVDKAPAKARRTRTSTPRKSAATKTETAVKPAAAVPGPTVEAGKPVKSAATAATPPSDPETPDQSRKKGWWQRTFG